MTDGGGFRARVYKIAWPEGHEYHGLEMRFSGLTLAELNVITGVQDMEGRSREERDAAVNAMVATMAEHLISWNYLDIDGNPVGTTAADIAKVDMRIVLPAAMAWAQKVSQVPAPLELSSPSGPPRAAASEVMDLPSPSL